MLNWYRVYLYFENKDFSIHPESTSGGSKGEPLEPSMLRSACGGLSTNGSVIIFTLRAAGHQQRE